MTKEIPRWLTHALVLMAIVVMPLAAGSIGSPSRPGSGVDLFALRAAASGRFSLSPDRGFIIKPAGPMTVASTPPVKVTTYSVQSGDVLGGIAEKFGLRLDTVRQSNQLANADSLQIGQQLLIPPTNGILVKVAGGDTVKSLSATYHVDASQVIQYNLIRDPEHLEVGALLMLPDGTGLLPAYQPQIQSPSSPGSSGPPPQINYGRSSYNNFPFGQCTYWVASQRNIPWNGNAWEWFGQGQRAGRATGRTPQVGAIMVTWENRVYGHVALVEAVYPDGSWLVSEMNYQGWGVVDRRRIHPGQVPLIGFVY